MSNFFIPDPCHENWDKMTPQEQGKHCAVCDKVVVDFTKKNPVEIDEIMKGQTGKVCGHFTVNQLNAEAQMKVFRKPSNLFNRNWKYFAMATLGFMSLSRTAEAQKTRGKVAPIRGDVAPVEHHNVNTSISTISGSVRQFDGSPAGGAEIIVFSNGQEIARATAIANGSFVIKIQPGKIVNSKVDVSVNYSHTQSKYMADVVIDKANTRLLITLDEMMMLKGEIEMIEPPMIDTVVKSALPVDQTAPKADTATCGLKDEKTHDPADQEKNGTTGTELPVNTEEPVKNEFEGQGLNFVIRPEDITASIYPNPAGTSATVYCNRNTSYKIEVYDEKGALRLTKAFYGDRTQIDVSSFANGNYYVQVRDDENHSNVLKLIKQ